MKLKIITNNHCHILLYVDVIRIEKQLRYFYLTEACSHLKEVNAQTKAPLLLLFTLGLISFNILTLLFTATYTFCFENN